MNPRIAKALLPRLSPGGLMVLVIVLAFSFVAMVLIPGLELASELADTTVALKCRRTQQRNPTLIRASLETDARPVDQSRLPAGVAGSAARCQQQTRCGPEGHERAAAGQLVRAFGRHRRQGRTDLRQARRAAARRFGPRSRRCSARCSASAACPTRTTSPPAPCSMTAAGNSSATSAPRHPRQPPRRPQLDDRVGGDRRRAAGGQRARRDASCGWSCSRAC